MKTVRFWAWWNDMNTLIPWKQNAFLKELLNADNTNEPILLTHQPWAKYFSTWMDLYDVYKVLIGWEDVLREHIKQICDDIYAPQKSNSVTIWIIDGSVAAIWWWLEMLLSCDYLLLSSDCRIGLPEMKYGFIPGAWWIPNGIQMLWWENIVSLLTNKRPVKKVSELDVSVFNKERVMIFSPWQGYQELLTQKVLSKRKLDNQVYVWVKNGIDKLLNVCVTEKQKKLTEELLHILADWKIISFIDIKKLELGIVLELLGQPETKAALKSFVDK